MRKTPHLHTWQSLLAQQRGDEQAALIAAGVGRRYAALLDQHPPFVRPAQARRLQQLILPGLALYQALQEYNPSPESCLTEIEQLFKASLFLNERRFVAWVNRLPFPFPLVRLMLRQIVDAGQETVEDSPQAFAFHVHQCFILDVLRFYQSPELTALYCKTDDWIAEAMPKVRWLRTQTLARGDAVCNFRWEKK